MTATGPAVVVLTAAALPLARRIAVALPGAAVHGLAGRADAADVTFSAAAPHLRSLYAAGTPIVGLMAAGVLVRSLAGVLADKRTEPPVLAVAEDASAVVPLLGGHHGANALARTIGALLAVPPAITTAGDLRFAVALDEPPAGWRLGNPDDVKPFTAALLAGERVRLAGTAPWLAESRLPFAADGALAIVAGPETAAGSPRQLVYYPAVLALGVGCERGAAAEEIAALVRATLAGAGLAAPAVGGVYSLDLKADEPALQSLADALGVPFRLFEAAALEAETGRLANPSAAVFRAVGCHGVAEAAALAAAGPEGRLLVAKRKSARATCAVALAPDPATLAAAGRPRGALAVVGIGPGRADWLTPEAAALIDGATDVVGYDVYLDLLGERLAGRRCHRFPIGAETERVEAALELAAAGRAVVLVSSGDAGIYAMASLVFERLEHGPPAWRRPHIRVAPGISALQAAAARVGAPLGHDFCAISLSDLLTPWPVIEGRVAAAAAADFVIAFYNPVSQRRRHQLARAREILLEHRPADTPVVLARNLGRPGEAVTVTSLAALDPAVVDMLTLVLVGASSTRAVAGGDGTWVYTPRGYAGKAERQAG